MEILFQDSLKRKNEIKQGNAELNRNMEEEENFSTLHKVGENTNG